MVHFSDETSYLGLLLSSSRRKANAPQRVPLPPPAYGTSSFGNSKPIATSFKRSVPPYHGTGSPAATAPPAPSSTYDNQVRGSLSSFISVMFTM